MFNLSYWLGLSASQIPGASSGSVGPRTSKTSNESQRNEKHSARDRENFEQSGNSENMEAKLQCLKSEVAEKMRLRTEKDARQVFDWVESRVINEDIMFAHFRLYCSLSECRRLKNTMYELHPEYFGGDKLFDVDCNTYMVTCNAYNAPV